jgi:hypothetical protein
MYQWHAKVHKSGTKVAVFNGTKLIKIVEASEETFEPAEAQKFAEELIDTLKTRTSAQMQTPSAAPSTTTETELQNASMEVATQQATGKGADATNSVSPSTEVVEMEEKLASENEDLKSVVAVLKKKLAQERNERSIERKARRGLAIAQQLVTQGVLEDSYDAIRLKVSEITKLEDSEIDRIERKVAGEHEFESVEDAERELRRQARIARINRQAAAEAQEDNDEEQADTLDRKADEAEAKVAHIEQIIEEMNKTAEETATDVEEEKADEAATENKAEEEKADETTTENKADEAATENKVEEEKADEAEPVKPVSEPVQANVNKNEKLAEIARTYRTIAANHRKCAEEAEAKGDIETADEQDALGDAAEEKAEDIEKKLAENVEPFEEEKADETDIVDEKKEAAKVEPGKTVTSSKHHPLKREDGEVIESFGIDKNASLVEENSYSNDPEVEILSKMWQGVPKDLD